MSDHNRVMGWCNWRWPSCLLFLCLLFMLLALGRNMLLNDSDTFWHIAVGKQILTERHLIWVDSFTFTFAGQPWIANQWLGECAMSLINDLAGFDGLVLVTAAMLAAIFAFAGHRMLIHGVNWLLVFGIVLFAVAISAYGLLARPKVFSIFALGIVYMMLIDVEAGKRKLACLFYLLPLFFVWANVHGGVLGGIGTVALVFAAWALKGKLDGASPINSVNQLMVGAGIFLACMLVLVIGPYGTELPRAWQSIMSLPLKELIVEHRPLNLLSPLGWIVASGFVGYLIILCGNPRRFARPVLLMPIVWFLLCLTRARYVPLFAVVTLFAVAELLPTSSMAGLLKQRGWIQPRKLALATSRSAILFAAIVVFALAGIAIAGKQRGDFSDGIWASPTAEIWPIELLPVLTKFGDANADEVRIFNEPRLSGFLIYHADNSRVFIDGRCELFGEPFMRQFVDGWNHPALLDQWDEAYGFDAALVSPHQSFFEYCRQSSQWELIEMTDAAALFFKKQD